MSTSGKITYRLLVDHPFVLTNFQNDAVQINNGVNRIDRAVLPLMNLIDHALSHLGNERC